MKCDRCGQLYEHYEGSNIFKKSEKANAIYLIDRDLNKKYWGRKDYDLCPECMRKLEDFLKGNLLARECIFISLLSLKKLQALWR
jgi:rubredoxin